MATKKQKKLLKRQQQNTTNTGAADLSLSDDQLEKSLEQDTPDTSTAIVTEAPKPKKPSEQDHFTITEGDHEKAKWYVIHTYSGHENRVAQTLIQRAQALKLDTRFFEILVPSREKIEIKSGKREKVQEKVLPGYMFVRMILDDESWLAVRTTQGITGFVGTGNKPTPISPSEVATIRQYSKQAPVHKAKFSVNQAVRITDGPFTDFLGNISEIDEARGKVKILVSMFGRETPVELDFLQVTTV